ncbi:hypothetical protein D915_003371 [Fasciola hepatica]|uniref:Uncharacterized protein n=1 Tax=Fasciola hepatica TaxID=6192 RepID=A0A4E0RGL2_FASHE|nr:hypothetical protein D915_003371 [Fasciola hepatica]
MGVRGLSTYISHDPNSFVKFELHNTYLVFDAENFINHCYRNSGLARHYGGEYMDFTVCVQIFLEQLRQCQITPIFVFDGCHGKQGLKLDTLLRRNRERIASLLGFLDRSRHIPDADNLSAVPDILPKLTNSVFVDVLRQNNALYVSCEREADVHVAELACLLRCPLVTNDSDFYIFRPSAASHPIPPSSDVSFCSYQVIPLASLGQPCRLGDPGCGHCSSSSSCYVLPCTMFNPQASPLGRVYPPLLPLLATMIGNDFISSVRVPPMVNQMIQDPSRCTRFPSYNGRRIDALVQWLSSFGEDINGPIRTILTLYSEAERELIAHQIRQTVLDYTLRPWATGRKLAELLHLPTGQLIDSMVPTRIAVSGSQSEKNTVSVNFDEDLKCVQSDYRDPKLEIRRLVDFVARSLPTMQLNLTGFELSPSCAEDSLSHGWPCALIRKLHFLDLPTGIMDTLYVQNGSVQRILFEDLLGQSASIYQVLDPLRQMFYNLLVGLETACHGSNKLCGIRDGCAMEHRRKADCMQPFSFSLSAMRVPPSQKSLSIRNQSIDFLWARLNLIQLNKFDPLPRELQLISAVLVLWFRHSNLAHYEQVTCECSSIPLAFVVCALTSHSFLSQLLHVRSPSLGHAVAELCESFTNLASRFKTSSVSGRFVIQLVHQLNELQLLVLEIKTLVGLIEGLMENDRTFTTPNPKSFQTTSSSGCLDLIGWPSWILFPSGRLIYWLATCLQGMHPKSRYDQAVNVWLPRVHMACPPKGDWCNVEVLKQRMNQIFHSVSRCIQG